MGRNVPPLVYIWVFPTGTGGKLACPVITLAVGVSRVVGLVVSPKARRTLADFLGGGIRIVSVPIIVVRSRIRMSTIEIILKDATNNTIKIKMSTLLFISDSHSKI